MLNLENELNKLPIISDKISQLFSLKYSQNYDTRKLLDIIQKDSTFASRIMELSNSKLFGFSNPIETPSKALNLYGMNFTIAICICELVKNSLKFDLDAYGITYKSFNNISDLSLKILFEWLDESDAELKEKLIIPIYLHEIGKFLVSKQLKIEDKKEEFLSLIDDNKDITFLEKDYLGISSSEISSAILKKWKIDPEIIDIIHHVDNPHIAVRNNKAVYILNVIKTLCDITNPLDRENINLAIFKATEYELDCNRLKLAINKLTNKKYN